jgi:hypothetical protein
MSTLWLQGTKFTLKNRHGGVLTWTVGEEDDHRAQIISAGSKAGRQLLASLPGDAVTISGTDGGSMPWEVLEVVDEGLTKLLAQFRQNPRGIRNEPRMRAVCLRCGLLGAKPRSTMEYYFRVCPRCWNEWYVDHCWWCRDGWVDARDPETPLCPLCNSYRCTICGACGGTCRRSAHHFDEGREWQRW